MRADPSPRRALTPAQRAFLLLQHAVPRRALSALAGRLARLEAGALTTLAIRAFVRVFAVDLSEAAAPDPAAYATFNAFFTRALAPGARPLSGDRASVVSPADGRLSALGELTDGTLLQAKGVDYGLEELFDGDGVLAERFRHGSYATLYLAPYDYHRVHAPLAAQPRFLRYVPGDLYSVNALTTQALPGLFCRNERVIVVCECSGGWVALVMVGAMNVGSIELAGGGPTPLINRPRGTLVPQVTVALDQAPLARGAEFGRFNLGSTVIVLASPGLLRWLPERAIGQRLRQGEALGRLAAAAA